MDAYTAAGRVTGGEREAMLDTLFAGWRADVAAGRRSLMIADDNTTVADLNTRAQTERRTATSHEGSRRAGLADGSTATVGDLVVTRRNDRTLATGQGWIKNGDTWTVTAIDTSGAVTVQRAGRGGATTLPVHYVREPLELGYATTAHRAQGRTVDTAHAYLSAGTTREPLYVMATRGRDANRLYIDTAHEPDSPTAHGQNEHLEVIDALQQVIAASTAEAPATETRRREQQLHHARSLSRPVHRIAPAHTGPSHDLL